MRERISNKTIFNFSNLEMGLDVTMTWVFFAHFCADDTVSSNQDLTLLRDRNPGQCSISGFESGSDQISEKSPYSMILTNLFISVTSRKLMFSEEAYCGDWVISLVMDLNHGDKKISLADPNGSFDSKFGTKINFSQISNVFKVELFRLRENPLESQN